MKQEKRIKQRAAGLVRTVLQSEHVLFFQTVFADGTLDKPWVPELLLAELKAREDFPKDMAPFLVTQKDSLNELAPVEVLAGRRFQAQIDNPVRVVQGATGSYTVNLTDADKAAHNRVFDHKLHERVIRVIYAVRDHFHPAY